MKFYIHHLYLLLAFVAVIICLCSSALVTFGYTDMSMVTVGNFTLRSITMPSGEMTSSVASCALGILLIVSTLINVFTVFVSLFQNFTLQKRCSVLNTILLAGYYIVLLVITLIMKVDTSYVNVDWKVALPLIALILTVMSFYSIRMTEAKRIAAATNFRLRD